MPMNKKTLKNSILLVITAAIWGFAFVAQSVGGDAVGPYVFNVVRFIIGSIVLIPVIFIKDAITKGKDKPKTKADVKNLIVGGILCGISLCVASNLQQVGITMGTSAGKAGFLTACYILIVPILSIFLKKKCPWTVWVGVVIALFGLYLLCIKAGQGFSIETHDLIVFSCAICFSIQILFVDKYSPLVDGVRLSCIQFAIAGTLSAMPAYIFDIKVDFSNAEVVLNSMLQKDALVPILYAGVMSCGIAYTLQIIGQNGLNPTIASLVMSLESAFSVLGGWLILGESLSLRELIGCALIFIAIILAQIEIKKKKRKPIIDPQ